MAKYAILLNAAPETVGPAANGLQYALKLDDAGHQVAVYLDGAATKWPGEVETRTDHPVNEYLVEILDRGITVEACAFCATAHGGVEGCREVGIPLRGDADEHGPDVGELASDGYRLLTVG